MRVECISKSRPYIRKSIARVSSLRRELLLAGALLFALQPVLAEPCTVFGTQYDCQPATYTPWRYTAYVAGGFAAPWSDTPGAALAYSLAAFEKYFRPLVHSISYGGLAPATEGELESHAYMPVYVVYYPGSPPDPGNFARVSGFRNSVCPVGIQEYHPDGFPGRKVCLVPKPAAVIAIDPGHGLDCEKQNERPGSVGVTNFPASDPPAGYLREDQLTVAFALEIQRTLPASKYKVVLTKEDVQSCPSLVDRGRIANNNNAKVFISVHVNAPNKFGSAFPFANGTSTYYHPTRPNAKPLADLLAAGVAGALGVNNRGSFENAEYGVIKPSVTRMTAVLLETARLSGTDETFLHFTSAPARVASGVQQALDAFVR
jgi:N-acetylmuramoyl-L-alanine amidase